MYRSRRLSLSRLVSDEVLQAQALEINMLVQLLRLLEHIPATMSVCRRPIAWRPSHYSLEYVYRIGDVWRRAACLSPA